MRTRMVFLFVIAVNSKTFCSYVLMSKSTQFSPLIFPIHPDNLFDGDVEGTELFEELG